MKICVMTLPITPNNKKYNLYIHNKFPECFLVEIVNQKKGIVKNYIPRKDDIIKHNLSKDEIDKTPRYFKIDKNKEIEYELSKEQINATHWDPPHISYDPKTDTVFETLGENNKVIIKDYYAHNQMRILGKAIDEI